MLYKKHLALKIVSDKVEISENSYIFFLIHQLAEDTLKFNWMTDKSQKIIKGLRILFYYEKI